jgi:HEAT repeat protein
MSSALRAIVLTLAVMVVLLNVTIVVIRVVLVRRQRRQLRLRPGVEALIADYLTDEAAVPSAIASQERAVLLDVATEAVADLRGAERARLVGLLEDLGFVSEAIRGLSARRRVSRRQAAGTLATIESRAAVGALLSALDDRDAQVRATCAYALAEIGGEDVVRAVVATIVRDATVAPGATALAMLALGDKRPAALAPLLAPDVAPEVRLTAITVVSELRLSQHLPSLRVCLADRGDDSADEVAASAAHGLGLIGDTEAVDALIDLAADTSRPPTLRATAVRALGSIGALRAVPVLEAQLLTPGWPVRAAAASALAGPDEPGIAALRGAANSTDAQVRMLSEAALQS